MSSASLISFDRENLGDEIFMHAAARFAHLAQKEEITQNNQVKYTKSRLDRFFLGEIGLSSISNV